MKSQTKRKKDHRYKRPSKSSTHSHRRRAPRPFKPSLTEAPYSLLSDPHLHLDSHDLYEIPEYQLTFGPHLGKTLNEVEKNYLQALIRKGYPTSRTSPAALLKLPLRYPDFAAAVGAHQETFPSISDTPYRKTLTAGSFSEFLPSSFPQSR